jgi:hypothetical protein
MTSELWNKSGIENPFAPGLSVAEDAELEEMVRTRA